MTALAKIHAMRRELPALADEDTWRDVLERVTGSRSAKGMSYQQSDAVVAELKRLGARGAPKRPRVAASNGRSKAPSKGISGNYAPKLQALWIAAWNLGLIDDPSDAALNTFAQRQTGLGHANWIRDPEHARSVIEALKAMTNRAGVYWGPIGKLDPAWQNRAGYRIVKAQWRTMRTRDKALMAKPLYAWVRELTGSPIEELDSGGWIIVMNALGRMLRTEDRA